MAKHQCAGVSLPKEAGRDVLCHSIAGRDEHNAEVSGASNNQQNVHMFLYRSRADYNSEGFFKHRLVF